MGCKALLAIALSFFSAQASAYSINAGSWIWTLPPNGGTNSYPLTVDGSGVSTWSQLALGTAVTGTLPVANGGTGNSTPFTTGSVVFAGVGALAQDNASFFWDDTNNRLGLGTVTPAAPVDIVHGTGVASAQATGYAAASTWAGRRANGTVGTPTAIANGNTITQVTANAHDGTAFGTQNNASMSFFADQAWTPTSHGAGIAFRTTSVGSTANAIRAFIDSAGNFTLGLTVDTAKLGIRGTADITQLRARANATQTNPILEVVNSAGTATATVADSGTMQVTVPTGPTAAFSATNNGSGNGILLNGTSVGPRIAMNGTGPSAGNTLGLTVPSSFVNYNFVLPNTGGTSGYFLQTDGTGATTWAAVASTSLQGAYDDGNTINTSGSNDVLVTGPRGVRITGDRGLAITPVSSATPSINVNHASSSFPAVQIAKTSSGPESALYVSTTNAATTAPAILSISNSTTGSAIQGNQSAAGVAAITADSSGTANSLRLSGSSPATRMRIGGSTSGELGVTVPAVVTATVPLVLPGADGAASTVLTNNGVGVLSWTAPAATAANGADGSIQFATSGAFDSEATKLFWDKTNDRLGVGMGAPAYTLDVTGQLHITDSGERFRMDTVTYNIAMGSDAGSAAGVANTAFGVEALKDVAAGARNTAIGATACGTVTTGDGNVCIGNDANTAAVSTSYGFAMGRGSIAGDDSIAIGHDATATGSEGMAFGPSANSATNSIMIGGSSGNPTQSGADNTMVGRFAGSSLDDGAENTGLGLAAGAGITDGDQNTALGERALHVVTTGSNNTGVGRQACNTVSTGTQNTCLGSDSDVSATLTNATAIGYGAVATASDTIMMGNGSAAVIIPETGGNGGNVFHEYTRNVGTPTASATCTASCPNPGNEKVTGGGCEHSAALAMQVNTALDDDTWTCTYLAYVSGDCTATAICTQY